MAVSGGRAPSLSLPKPSSDALGFERRQATLKLPSFCWNIATGIGAERLGSSIWPDRKHSPVSLDEYSQSAPILTQLRRSAESAMRSNLGARSLVDSKARSATVALKVRVVMRPM